MKNVKRLALIGLFISALTVPATAFASAGTVFASQSVFQSAIDHVNLFLFGYQGMSNSDWSINNNYRDKHQWEDNNKEDRPKQDSYHIWQDWYCK